MPLPVVYLWKKAPAIRLLIPLLAGIVLQWYWPLPLKLLVLAGCFCLFIISAYSFFPVAKKWRFSMVNGIAVSLLVVCAGALLTYTNDIRNDKDWIGRMHPAACIATLQEPLVENAKSYKAIAAVQKIRWNNSWKNADGTIIIYLKKDTTLRHLSYGSTIVFTKPLQLIKSAGNPGSFNYQQYALFQGITDQVYLSANDLIVLPQKQINNLRKFIYQCRKTVVGILRRYIEGPKEQGLAEALLIGYKDDLDKSLVQSYSNTGVVHIIAISGLHLGLIYWLLLLLTKPLKIIRNLNWLRIIVVISGLWLFSILAGGQPSVLRSAVIFTFIALAEVFDRRTSVYNTLALSAFLLLCYNPFWLWDVGFQLSYAAVLSIIIFFRPVYNLIYFSNKAVDFIWKLNAVTLSAQLLTLPVSLYHFHQFPNLFLFTNMVAVPLSSLILMGEILLCLVSFIPVLAIPTGKIITIGVHAMNAYIERLNGTSLATWNGIYITLPQTILLLAAIAGASYWLLQKSKRALFVSLLFLLLFTMLRTASFMQANRQQKLIVYNVPRHQAIDIIHGRTYAFIGDSLLLNDDFARNFYLQPTRILYRVQPEAIPTNTGCFIVNDKRIAIIDRTVYFQKDASKVTLNLIILSGNPKVYIPTLHDNFNIGQIVIDGSVPAWRAARWKHDCDSLQIPYYDVSENGAFVMNL